MNYRAAREWRANEQEMIQNMKIIQKHEEMKRIIFIILGCINICLAYAQSFNGQYISEWQWDMNRNTNLINQLRLERSVPI